MFQARGQWYKYNEFVRPVVTLSSDVTLTGSGDDVGSSTNNMWQISVN